jgi:hypothetical protein
MTAKRIIVSAIVVGLLALTVALVMMWYPTAPGPPSQADLDRLESRFTVLRSTLEEIVAFEQREKGYRLATAQWIEDIPNEARSKAHAEYAAYEARQARLLAGTRPRIKRVDALSDSLIYIWAWERRGYGFDAGWAFAGYAYSTRPLAQGARSSRKHLVGSWYLVSTVPGF